MSLANWGGMGGRCDITIEYAKNSLEVKTCALTKMSEIRKELSSSCKGDL